MMYLAIDPGITGAWACINHHGEYVACGDMPVHQGRVVASTLKQAILGAIAPLETGHIVIEQVHAMPGQGVTSMFSFGHACGVVHAVADMLPFPFVFVTPQCWKKHHGLIGTEKVASLYKAREIWPDAPLHLKKHTGRADALLMAMWLMGEMQ